MSDTPRTDSVAVDAFYDHDGERTVKFANHARTLECELAAEKAKVARLREALVEIAWSNDSQWQSDCARAALKETADG